MRPLSILLLSVVALASVTALCAEPERRSVKARVIVFAMDEESGSLTPRFWRDAEEWPDLVFETEEDLVKALKQTDDDRKQSGAGLVVVRAVGRDGKINYRGIMQVPLWTRSETYGAKGARPQPPERVKTPTFSVVVPFESKRICFDGWLPLTKSKFDLQEIAARYPNPDRQEK